MNSIEQIDLLNTLFYVGLVATIVFLILAVILFFAFKIPQIYMMRTGKAQRKTIEQMQRINADTGRLQGSEHSEKGISQIFGKSTDLGRNDKTAILMDREIANNVPPSPEQPKPSFGETAVLAQNPLGASANGDIGETTVLSQLIISEQQGSSQDNSLPEPDSSYGKFTITKYMIKVHTNEVIA